MAWEDTGLKKLTIIVIESIICNIVYKFNVETIVPTRKQGGFLYVSRTEWKSN